MDSWSDAAAARCTMSSARRERNSSRGATEIELPVALSPHRVDCCHAIGPCPSAIKRGFGKANPKLSPHSFAAALYSSTPLLLYFTISLFLYFSIPLFLYSSSCVAQVPKHALHVAAYARGTDAAPSRQGANTAPGMTARLRMHRIIPKLLASFVSFIWTRSSQGSREGKIDFDLGSIEQDTQPSTNPRNRDNNKGATSEREHYKSKGEASFTVTLLQMKDIFLTSFIYFFFKERRQ